MTNPRIRRRASSVALLSVLWAPLSGCGEPPSPREGASAPVVFLGSSTIARFPLGDHFPGASWVNHGRGNETAPELLRRLQGIAPDVRGATGIVLYAGSADHRFDPGLPPDAIARRVDAVLLELSRLAPGVPILVLEILPATRQTDEERAALRALNAAVEAAASARGAAWMATHRPPLVDPHGDLSEALSVDRHHLGPEGYRALAAMIRESGSAATTHLR